MQTPATRAPPLLATRDLVVVKLGGSVLPALPASWWDDAAGLARSRRLILVHGWSRPLREWRERRHATSTFLVNQHGYRSRLTDDEVIGDIREVAADLRDVVGRRLASRGITALGVDAADDSLLTAEVIPQRWWVDGELRAMDNLVGPVSAVDSGAIRRLLGQADVLVVTPLARSARHRYVNVDADRAAAAIAIAVGATCLVLVTDVPGVLVGAAPAPVLRASQIADLLGEISGGMRKKVTAAASAARAGVARVAIGHAAIADLMAGRAGTRMLA